jgi:hypothetical protein
VTRNNPAACMALLALVVALPAMAFEPDDASKAHGCDSQQYIFSWSLADDCLPKPRGGSSKGAPVTLDTAPSGQWQALQQPGIGAFERDRRAILAMAGGYRASFEFIETVGYDVGYKLAAPYQSWGTEYVYVIEDRGDFISLQHIMVMRFAQDDGTVSAPVVMKHWRQDWQYEGTQILEYAGNDTWRVRKLDKGDVRGKWTQSVYQVDDSPRYASLGSWQHNASFSVWTSGNTARPLPRREHTVRDDYQILEGINRHVILPTGWVQEEQNQKLRLPLAGGAAGDKRYVANELGNNRYQRIAQFDWSAGDAYWNRTAPFWASVRRQWAQLIARHGQFTLKQEHEGRPLFVALFDLARQYEAGRLKDADNGIAAVLTRHVAGAAN